MASQLSLVQEFSSLQTTPTPGWQLPLTQTSFLVHALPSLQLPELLACLQPPVGSQLSLVHKLLSSQLTAPPPLQTPFLQTSGLTSVPVHTLPSLHTSPLRPIHTQPLAGSQLSLVHGLLSSQLRLLPPVQTPLVQTSPLVQALPSLHGVPLLAL